MKLIFLNDTHFGVRGSSQIFEEHILKFFDHVIQYCIDNDIKRIHHLGDFLDRRKEVNFRTLYSVKGVLKKMEDAGIDFYVVHGNHDSFYKNTGEINSVDLLFREFSNVKVFNEPTEVDIGSERQLLVPWISTDYEEEWKKIIKKSRAETCAGHFEFRGFQFMPGVITEDGDDPNYVSSFRDVFSGHYHSKSSNGNIHYLGTQYDLTWSDYGEKKYFHVYDSEAGELTPIEYDEKIFVKLVFTDEITKKDIDEDDMKRLKGKIIKIIVKSKKNQTLFDYFLDKIYEANPHDVAVIDEMTDFTEPTKQIIIANSTFDIIKDYVTEVKMDDIDNNKLLNMINKIYSECENEE